MTKQLATLKAISDGKVLTSRDVQAFHSYTSIQAAQSVLRELVKKGWLKKKKKATSLGTIEMGSYVWKAKRSKNEYSVTDLGEAVLSLAIRGHSSGVKWVWVNND